MNSMRYIVFIGRLQTGLALVILSFVPRKEKVFTLKRK